MKIVFSNIGMILKHPFFTHFTTLIIGLILAMVPIKYSDLRQSETKKEEQRMILINKRIDLIDKTANLFYKLPATAEFFAYGFEKNSDTVKINPFIADPLLVPKNPEISKQMGELRGEFFAILIQDQLYFGNRTRKFLSDSIFKENEKNKRMWFHTPEDKYRRLLEIMTSEIQISQ